MPAGDCMTDPVRPADLWTLALERPQIDPSDLAAAIERQVVQRALDFRTRLLIRDSLEALASFWGRERVDEWVRRSPHAREVKAIAHEDLGAPGFPSLRQRLMDATRPEVVKQYLRELGSRVSRPTRLAIGGSISLILSHRLSRRTEDIDVADEVPAILREQHELLSTLLHRYGLQLTHFQSHYLPAGWEARLKRLGDFGRIEVLLIDEYDVAAGKMFSARDKDRDDLRVLATQLDKAALADRLRTSARALLDEPPLRQNAQTNWYIVYGEPLPT